MLIKKKILAFLLGKEMRTVDSLLSQSGIEQVIDPNSPTRKNLYKIEDCRKFITSIQPITDANKAKVQLFFNFKGGVGKTSICAQIAWLLALQGFNVLVVDGDPQGHLTFTMGIDEDDSMLTLYDLLINGRSIEDTIKSVAPGLDILPSNLSLTKMDMYSSGDLDISKIFDMSLKKINDKYHFILIDTNPTISFLNKNLFTCSDMLNIICETRGYSIKGLDDVLQVIKEYYSTIEKELAYKIIGNKYDARTTVSQTAIGYLRLYHEEKLAQSVIRKSEDFNISGMERVPLFSVSTFKAKIPPALEDLKELVNEIIREQV